MTNEEALNIIESLAEGRCPITGQPWEGVLQQPNVIRALFLAAKALRQAERRDRKRGALPGHAGKAWNTVEEQQLGAEFDAGKGIAEISQTLQRTKGAIQSRLERLGKIPPPIARSPEA
jgi:hypothetical protein